MPEICLFLFSVGGLFPLCNKISLCKANLSSYILKYVSQRNASLEQPAARIITPQLLLFFFYLTLFNPPVCCLPYALLSDARLTPFFFKLVVNMCFVYHPGTIDVGVV